jgi:hypothetical protein
MATSNNSPQIFDLTNDSDDSYVFLSSFDEEETSDDEPISELIQKRKRELDVAQKEANNNKNKMRKTDSPVKQQIMKRKYSDERSSPSSVDNGNSADSESDERSNPSLVGERSSPSLVDERSSPSLVDERSSPSLVIAPIIHGLNFATGDWHCLDCGVSMGCHNPRQLCGKWCCLNAKMA